MKITTVGTESDSVFTVYVDGVMVNQTRILGENGQRKFMITQLANLVRDLRDAFTGNHIQVHRSWIQVDDAYDMATASYLVLAQIMAMFSERILEQAMSLGRKPEYALLDVINRAGDNCVNGLIRLLEKERYAKDEPAPGRKEIRSPVSYSGVPGDGVCESGGSTGADPARVDDGLPDVERPDDR